MVGMGEATIAALAHDAYCPACGYNVRGLDGCRCPECGKGFAPAELSASQIPWTQRRQVGRVRAFWRTVWFATFHVKQMTAGGAGELDRAAARRFRLVCEVMLAIPICTVLLIIDRPPVSSPGWLGAMVWSTTPSRIELWTGQLAAVWAMSAGWWPAVLLLGLAVAHGLAVFAPRLAAFPKYPTGQRENLITASEYLAGAWLGAGLLGAIAGAIVVSLGVGSGFISTNMPPGAVLAGALAAVTSLVGGLLWLRAWFSYFRQCAMITGTSMRGALGIGLLLVALWVGAWAVLMPLCIGVMLMGYRIW